MVVWGGAVAMDDYYPGEHPALGKGVDSREVITLTLEGLPADEAGKAP
jgi:hypothetical protein